MRFYTIWRSANDKYMTSVSVAEQVTSVLPHFRICFMSVVY
jgi:hypothetical protein